LIAWWEKSRRARREHRECHTWACCMGNIAISTPFRAKRKEHIEQLEQSECI
jgi:hypothetical protein